MTFPTATESEREHEPDHPHRRPGDRLEAFAQICELRRRRVRICYRCKKGTFRFALVPAAKVCLQQLLFAMDNPYNRGQICKTKTFEL